MTILRRIGLFISALLFCLCLAVLAFFAGLHIFNTPQPLEAALQSSGIYEEITPSILAEQTATPALPLRDVGVRTAFEQALPAAFYQHSSEQIVNGTYDWMRGSTPAPKFSIDTTPVKNNFANKLSAYVRQQLETLPPCDRPMAPPATTEEVLSLVCMPPHIMPADITESVRQQVLGSELLFKGDAITAATLKDTQGRTFTQQLSFLPGLYRLYVPILVILLVATILLVLAIVFWSVTRKTGLRRIAWMLLCVGLTGAVLAAVGAELFHMGARLFGLSPSISPGLQDKLAGTIETLAADVRPWWLGVCAGYVLIGVTLFIILRLRRPKQTLGFK